jgi:hypothetical protein
LELRNKAEVAREMKISPQRVYQIAKSWSWNERVEAYDNWLQGAEDKVLYEGREQLAREHLEVIRKARSVANEALTALLQSLRREGSKTEISPRDALAFLEKAVTLERLVTGEATDRVETFDLSKLTGDEAEKLLETLEKLK